MSITATYSEMSITATYKCKCDSCGRIFDSSRIVELSGTTIGGYGDKWQEFVSPCCHSNYDEIDDNEMI